MNIFPSKVHKEYAHCMEVMAPRVAQRHGVFEVEKLMVGRLKVKDSSSMVYRGEVFNVIGLYMTWPCAGLHTDGMKEYRVSLVGTRFHKTHGVTTTFTEHDIEWIDATHVNPDEDHSGEQDGLVSRGDMERMVREMVESDIGQENESIILMVARTWGIHVQ